MAKNLDGLFKPKNVAIIGASRDHNSVGYGILRNLNSGCVFQCKYCKPFLGNLYPVNPYAEKVQGIKSYASILRIEEDVDLAIISVPAKIVPMVMEECVEKKVKAMIIVSAGFAEIGEEGKRLQEKVAEIAKKSKIPVLGPNCLGVIRPSSNLNASFAPAMPPQGNISFISQSGALADSIIDWSIEARYGFSTVVSYGNRADLDVVDFLEYFADDEETKVITMYIEGLKDGKRFMEVAERVSKKKPIIALKAGRSEFGKEAISTHTGSLAGSYKVYEAAFKQAGVILADNVEEMFDIAKALAYQPPCKSNNIAIISNAGGPGVLATDYCGVFGINLPELKKSTINKLDKSEVMHKAYSRRNPLDLVGDALPERYKIAVNTLLSENYIDGLIIIQTLQTMTDPEEDAKVIIEAQKEYPDKPIICTYMGGHFTRAGIKLLEKNSIPDYNDPKKAVIAIKALINRYEYLKKK
jgi:acetate---CoA ligase (ADP-forming)